MVTALDVTAGRAGQLRVDLTCAARDTAHADAIVSALSAIPDAGDLAGAMRGADVFIGLSAPGILSGSDIAAMARERRRVRPRQP